MEEILYPVNGYRGTLARKGITPKNHKSENVRLLKEKHQEFVEKKDKLAESKKESILSTHTPHRSMENV